MTREPTSDQRARAPSRWRWWIGLSALVLVLVATSVWTPRWWPWRWEWAVLTDHAIADVIAAYATAAVGFFAAVTLWRELRADGRRRRAADAGVSAAAYSLRGPLLARVNDAMIDTEPYQWAYKFAQWAPNPGPFFQGLVEQSNEASGHVAEEIREAFVGFASASQTAVRTIEATRDARIASEAVNVEAVHETHAALVRGVAHLERAIDPRLLAIERGTAAAKAP